MSRLDKRTILTIGGWTFAWFSIGFLIGYAF